MPGSAGEAGGRHVDEAATEVSAIFKCFLGDFEKGLLGFPRLEDVFARPAAQLTDNAGGQARLRARRVSLRYLGYDWALNAMGRCYPAPGPCLPVAASLTDRPSSAALEQP